MNPEIVLVPIESQAFAKNCRKMARLGVLWILLLELFKPSVSVARDQTTDVTLIIFVQDKESFTLNRFNAYVKAREQQQSMPIRSAFLPMEKNEEEWLEIINKELRTNDKISVLILGTHGKSSGLFSRTSLEGIGGFNRSGTFGFLKSIFKSLSSRWNKSLVVFLESCATFCGSEKSIKSRTKALFDEISNYGVKDLLIWGAHYPILSSWKGATHERYKGPSSENEEIYGPIGNFLGITTGFLTWLYLPGYEGIFAGVASWGLTLYLTKEIVNQLNRVDTIGSLVQIDSDVVKIQDMDINDPRLVDLPLCKGALQDSSRPPKF